MKFYYHKTNKILRCPLDKFLWQDPTWRKKIIILLKSFYKYFSIPAKPVFTQHLIKLIFNLLKVQIILNEYVQLNPGKMFNGLKFYMFLNSPFSTSFMYIDFGSLPRTD